MELILWNAAIVVSKALFYFGFASIVGFAFLMHKAAKNRAFCKQVVYRLIPVLVLSLCASAAWFFAKTGAFSESGLQGAFDPILLEVMWDSPVGDVALARMLMSAIAIVTLLAALVKQIPLLALRATMTVLVIYGLYSFTLVGHIAEKGLADKLIMATHVAIMGWWFGALLPLKMVCQHFSAEDTKTIMTDFGRAAGYLVTILVLLGIYMAYTLFTSPEDLVQSQYGLTFLSKMLIVGLLLLLAARHRFVLVPTMRNADDKAQLKRSINIEILLAFALLLITSGLTSVVGPQFN